MRISIRTLTGQAAELDVPPSTTVAQLRVHVEDALRIPAPEQRFVYAGTQLEEEVTPAWRKRRVNSGGELAAALGVHTWPDGMPLTLEHHGLQKGSVVNVVRRAITSSAPATSSPGPSAEVVPEGPRLEWRSAPALQPQTPGRAEPQLPAMGPSRTEPQVTPAGSASELSSLTSSLDGLTDLQLHLLLQPVLWRRPAVRAALLAEDQSPVVRSVSASMPPAETVPNAPAGVAVAIPGKVPFPPQPPSPCAVQSRYAAGDRIRVWSNSAKNWYEGQVVQIATAAADNIPQGSIEVTFELGRKWVAPVDLPRTLKPK